MKAKTVFFCTDCGNESPKWQGKCSACGSWNTMVEQPAEPKTRAAKTVGAPSGLALKSAPKKLSELDASLEMRFSTGLSELDRVLGGGAVTGSLNLVGGAPGIGKSTLLLQICRDLGKTRSVLYVSGEESERQIKMRSERLGVSSDSVFVLAETDIDEVLASAASLQPNILIIDSIQTLYNSDLTSSPGSVGQVKECTMRLLQFSKTGSVTVFLIGHVNKEGAIAGPKVLEHMVDCVLYFEGEQAQNYRILRAAKNRFGSTNEIGVFEMTDKGLEEVANPSEMLLAGRPSATPGTCVTCVIEGTRPVLAEVQALVAPTSFNVPRRNTNGVDYNRAMMLLAILEKRCGLRTGACDAYINVIGGLTVDEPAADLATILSVASSYRDIPIDDRLVAVGEVGLTGELRHISQVNMRLSEISRMGFDKCILPANNKGKIAVPDGMKVFFAKNVQEALKFALVGQ